MSSNSPVSPGPAPDYPATGIALSDTGRPRIFSLDVIRGIAILGILIISIWEFGGFTVNKQTFFRTGTHGGNYNLLSLVTMIFEGKMRALFSLVFGAGIILFISKKEHSSPVSYPDLYIRRMLWLMIFGVFNAVVLLFPGDILFHYAALGILLFPCWRMNRKALLIAALVATLIYCGKLYWNYADDKKAYNKFLVVSKAEKLFVSADTATKQKIDSLLTIQKNDPLSNTLINDTLLKRYKADTLTKQQKKDKQAWEGIAKSLKYDSAVDKNENKAMRSTSYTKIWDHLLGKTQNRESYWLYRIGIWDIGSVMLLGMALLGFGFFEDRFPAKKYLLIAAPAIIIGLLLAWLRNHYLDLKMVDYAKYIDKNPVPYNQFFPIERLLLATGYAAFIMVMLRTKLLRWFWNTLATVGRMAFSNYFLQTILCTFFFYGYGLGFFGRMNQVQLYLVVMDIWLLQILFSVLWSRHFIMGPVEWLWRSLIYWKKLPLKKQTTTVSEPATIIY